MGIYDHTHHKSLLTEFLQHSYKLQLSLLFVVSVCAGRRADVIFLLDSSSSVWPPHFRNQLHFVADVIDEFDLSSDVTRVGVMTFSDRTRIVVALNEQKSKQELRDVITQTSQLRGSTSTHRTLAAMLEMLTWQGRDDVTTVVVVVTDGESDDPAATLAQVRRARDANITLLAVGVGDAVNRGEVTSLASFDDLVFNVDSFDELASIRENLTSAICAEMERGAQNDAPVNDVIKMRDQDVKPTKSSVDVTLTTEVMTSLDDEQILAKGKRN